MKRKDLWFTWIEPAALIVALVLAWLLSIGKRKL